MTREEMLKWLEQIEKDIYVCSLESTFADDAKSCAIHEAIKTLSAEPCEDTISRQAVLDINEIHHGQMPNHINHQIWKEIKSLPPVRPIRPKGKWIEYIDRNDYNDFESESYVCNKCHHIQYAATNFCSNCGADMRGEEHDA